jgi:hypothetical protein
MSTGMTVLSTGLRDGAHYLGRGTQGKPVKTNLVCLATNPDTDGFGQAQSQLSIQKHDVTVLGLDRSHAKEHGNYDECAHGAVYNAVEGREISTRFRKTLQITLQITTLHDHQSSLVLAYSICKKTSVVNAVRFLHCRCKQGAMSVFCCKI